MGPKRPAAATSPATAIAEKVCGAWLKELLRLPASASFAFVTGCQMAQHHGAGCRVGTGKRHGIRNPLRGNGLGDLRSDPPLIAAQLGDNPNEKQRANFGLPQDQWKDGICNSPHGASMDKDGNLLVAEWSAFGHLHKFAREK